MSLSDYKRLDTVACIVVAVLAAWATQQHPYSYYTMLRWLAFIVGGYMAWQLHQAKMIAPAITFAGVAIIFNPLAPFYLRRDTWATLDLMCAAVFLFGAYLTPRLKSL